VNWTFPNLHRRFALAIAITLGAALLTPAMAQDEELSPEDQARFDKLKLFLANLDEFLPTVNIIPADRLPVTFPYEEVLDHIVVDVAFGDDEPLPFMFDTGAGTFVS